MPHHTPRHLPDVGTLLDAIAGNELDVARAFHVTLRTVRRWRAHDSAPQSARVALFWMSRWGRQHMHANLVHEADLFRGYCASLRLELAEAGRRITRLQRALDEAPGGAANCPLFSDGAPPRLHA